MVDSGEKPTVLNFLKFFNLYYDGLLIDSDIGNIATPEVEVIKAKVVLREQISSQTSTDENGVETTEEVTTEEWVPIEPFCFESMTFLQNESNLNPDLSACMLTTKVGGVKHPNNTGFYGTTGNLYDDTTKINILPNIEKTQNPLTYPERYI